jgi:hypothetical protein
MPHMPVRCLANKICVPSATVCDVHFEILGPVLATLNPLLNGLIDQICAAIP